MTNKVPFPAFEALDGQEKNVALTAAAYALSLTRQCETADDRQIVCAAALSTALSLLHFTGPKWGITKVAIKSMLESINAHGIDSFNERYAIPHPPAFRATL